MEARPLLRERTSNLPFTRHSVGYAADKVDNASACPTDLKTRADVNRWLLWECGAWFASCYILLRAHGPVTRCEDVGVQSPDTP